jgi:SOS-response transcriptional repressor LexA
MTDWPPDFRATWFKVEDNSMVESQITFLPGQYIGVDEDAPVVFGDLVMAKRERDASPCSAATSRRDTTSGAATSST